ncbi:Putative uncharacterized protein [Escherichia coli D6-117.29]|nr:Protein of unknown function [Escherichia coli]CDP77229.1 Putative uncharacterized protein [Escherichia coli D6-117.29]CDU40622.1 Protein of unknown function [Escherichia coli]
MRTAVVILRNPNL